MSIVDDEVRRYDALLDKYQLALASSRKSSLADPNSAQFNSVDDTEITKLKSLIRSLSSTSRSKPLLKRRRLRQLLLSLQTSSELRAQDNVEDTELLWLAAGKATVQLYGTILSSLLDQTIPLSESLWYWDDVLGSHVKTGLYMLQTSPIRMWNTGTDVYREARRRYQSNLSVRTAAAQSTQTFTQGWQEFYGLVQDSLRDRSFSQARTRILSPFALSRTEARRKQDRLKHLRQQSATAIGLLVDEGLVFANEYEDAVDPEWRATIHKSVVLLQGVLAHSSSIDQRVGEFEDAVFDYLDRTEVPDHPTSLADMLLQTLDHLPEQEKSAEGLAWEYGRPSTWVRYWIPGVLIMLSGGTMLRVLANRRAEITLWMQELGQTTMDFWYNWVLEPVRRLVGTIRHDESSELALMSRDSLKSDRDSLERMVVDFAVEHPPIGRAYNESEIAEIRAKVNEGDLTPVLRAYEQDMKSPIVKAITGNLVRALLIQIQKTKVDVEVAIGGIDSLLKSQELLFGFVGLAPGILVSYFFAQWLRSVLGNRHGIDQQRRQGETVRLLRNIDRTLSNCQPTEAGVLTYKDHGLLICEVYVLRQRAGQALPGRVRREFLEDIHDLLDVRQGVAKQQAVVQRIYRAYSKWLT